MQTKRSIHATRLASALAAWLVAFATVIGLSAREANAFKFRKVVDELSVSIQETSTPAVSGDYVMFGCGFAICRTTINGRRLKHVFRDGDEIPGGFGEFDLFDAGRHATLYNGVVILRGASKSPARSVGLYARSIDRGPITTLVDINTFLPGSTTDKFGAFKTDFHVDGNHVVFQAGNPEFQVFAVPLAGGPVNAVAGEKDRGFSPPEPFCCFFVFPTLHDASGTVLLRAGNSGHGEIQTVNRDGSTASFQRVVGGTAHPPKTPVGYHFDDTQFLYPVIDKGEGHEFFVFRGQSTNDISGDETIQGIYSIGPAGFFRLADTRQDVPGGTGKFQLNPGFGPIAARNGIVIFQARDAAGKDGIYLVRATGGRIRKILAVGDTLDGRVVQGFGKGLRRDGFDGTTLAFFAVVNGVFSIYTTQIALP